MMAGALHDDSAMSVRQGPIHDQDDPTIMAGARGARPPVNPAGVIYKSAVLIRTVPVVYDAADDGESLSATGLFDVPGCVRPASSARNFGGTAIMPAALGAQVRDAVTTSMNQIEARRAEQPLSTPGARPSEQAQRPADASLSTGLTRFELMFGVSAAVVVGLTAALLFVYLG